MTAVHDVPHALDGPALDSLGLSEGALAVYREMLRSPDRPVDELADVLTLDDDTVRKALDQLAAKGMVRRSVADRGRWRPISPAVALHRLVAEANADLQQRSADLTRMQVLVDEFVEQHRSSVDRRVGRLEHLTTPDAVADALEELTGRVATEILSFVIVGTTAAAAEPGWDSHAAALARGIDIRSIHLEGPADATFHEQAARLIALGAQVRVTPTLPLRMVVFDRAVAVVADDPADATAGAHVLRGEGVVAALVALFELQWEVARCAADEGPRRDDDTLTPMDREVLSLLSQGLKDDSVARRLGVSVRTTRRITADLSARTGATSRFELGVRAKELGWL